MEEAAPMSATMIDMIGLINNTMSGQRA